MRVFDLSCVLRRFFGHPLFYEDLNVTIPFYEFCFRFTLCFMKVFGCLLSSMRPYRGGSSCRLVVDQGGLYICSPIAAGFHLNDLLRNHFFSSTAFENVTGSAAMSADDSDFDKVQWQAIADENARDAMKKFPKAVLACECMWREVKARANRKGVNASGRFRWRVDFGRFRGEAEVATELCNIKKQGVPLPPGWKTALQLPDMIYIADKAVKATGARSGISDLTCTVLGTPRNDFVGNGIVQTSVVQHEGASIDVLLCARINGDRWVCHRGRHGREEREEDPFPFDGFLECEAIPGAGLSAGSADDLFPSDEDPTDLSKSAETDPQAWAEAVAVAEAKAAIAQSNAVDRVLFDPAQLTRSFENNPFSWGVDSRRQDIFALWSWRAGDGVRRGLSRTLLQHVITRGLVTPPNDFADSDSELLRRLEDAADRASLNTKAPCAYLGLSIAGGRYEKNPKKWPSNKCPKSRKNLVKVTFEWRHVRRDDEPHRVDVRVDHAVKHGIPYCPLSSSAPSNLVFSLGFLETVATSKREGIEFKGVCFESDRAEIVLQLPDAGVDIQAENKTNQIRIPIYYISFVRQEEPLYWTLPDGRCECWSLRELANAPDDVLADEDTEEAFTILAN